MEIKIHSNRAKINETVKICIELFFFHNSNHVLLSNSSHKFAILIGI